VVEKRLKEVLSTSLIFSFLALIFIVSSLFMYVAIYDYGVVNIYDVSEDLQSQGFLSAIIMSLIDNVVSLIQHFPIWVDYLFLLVFTVFVVNVIVSSYFTKREGYFTIFGFLSIFFIFLMFILVWFNNIIIWFKTNIYNFLPASVTTNLTFFNFYLDNLAIIHMIIIAICILLNFLDLDFSKFNSRKEKEFLNNENV